MFKLAYLSAEQVLRLPQLTSADHCILGEVYSRYGERLSLAGEMPAAERQLKLGHQLLEWARGPNDARTRAAAQRLSEHFQRVDDWPAAALPGQSKAH